jgi:hypothetical protein
LCTFKLSYTITELKNMIVRTINKIREGMCKRVNAFKEVKKIMYLKKRMNSKKIQST